MTKNFPKITTTHPKTRAAALATPYQLLVRVGISGDTSAAIYFADLADLRVAEMNAIKNGAFGVYVSKFTDRKPYGFFDEVWSLSSLSKYEFESYVARHEQKARLAARAAMDPANLADIDAANAGLV